MFDNHGFTNEFEMLEYYPPSWFPVKFAPGEPVSGEILVKFYACDLDTKLINPL
jgi:hypothetical protein